MLLLSAAPATVLAGTGVPPKSAAALEREKELAMDLRSAWLGTPLRRFQHLVPERRATPSSITYYSRPDETLNVGGFQVTGISYGFYKGLLCCIELRVLGATNCQGIQTLLARTYGPSQLAATPSQQWVNPQVRLVYTEMPKGFATIVVASTPLVAQYQAERQAASNEAA
ncbi:hypothetical protein [Hymenobacter tenuis]